MNAMNVTFDLAPTSRSQGRRRAFKTFVTCQTKAHYPCVQVQQSRHVHRFHGKWVGRSQRPGVRKVNLKFLGLLDSEPLGGQSLWT
mmetsp:Transcript_12126/g.28016  ORF Transcript_12126/g.28016 Transcript_12126/m.28016 type:complete len:86 (-) Transcript_12126:541-798(-)